MYYANHDANFMTPYERMIQMGSFARAIDGQGNLELLMEKLEALANGEDPNAV